MNKEVNYVLQGFLITIAVIGAFQFSKLLLSIPPPKEPVAANEQGYYGNASPATSAPLNPVAYKGKEIYQNNCASCHSVYKDLTGPALAGVEQRITDKKLLYKWVRNPAAVLKSGNVYFNALKKRYDNVQMTSFADLTDDEIDAIISYIEYR